MKIHGITPKINVCGQLRTGEVIPCGTAPDGSEKTRPVATSHFVFRGSSEAHEDEFRRVYTPEPKRIRIRLAGDTLGEVFPHSYQLWAKEALLCKGDGREILYREENPDMCGNVCAGPLVCTYSTEEHASKDGRPGCDSQGILYVMLPGITTCGEYGIYEMVVKRTSIPYILAALQHGERINGGRLFGLEYWATLIPKERRRPDGGGLTVWAISMDLVGSTASTMEDIEADDRRRYVPLGEDGIPLEDKPVEEINDMRYDVYGRIKAARHAVGMDSNAVKQLVLDTFNKNIEDLDIKELEQVPSLIKTKAA